MRKFLLFNLVLLLTSIPLFGQEKVEQYYSSLFNSQYDIFASEPNLEGHYSLFIYCQPSDGTRTMTNLVLTNKTQIEEFKQYLIYLRSMFVKWRKIAIDNNVKELAKKVEYKDINFQSGFYNTEWHFDFDVSLTSMFQIYKGKYIMAIISDKIISSSDDVFSDGFMIAFTSTEEFDKLLNGISAGKVISFYNSKKNKEELFK